MDKCCKTIWNFTKLNEELVPVDIQLAQFIKNLNNMSDILDKTKLPEQVTNKILKDIVKSLFVCNLKGKYHPIKKRGKFTLKKILEGKV